MAPINLIALSPSTYARDLDSDLTEHLQWYGPGKLHPTHLGDALGEGGRYTVVHKLDHSNHSLSWLVRDGATRAWRRIDVVHAAPDVSAHIRDRVEALLREREKRGSRDRQGPDADADARGTPLSTFFHRGPNGTHLCIVFPLNGAVNCFRWGLRRRDGAEMNEAWFVRQCARLRAATGVGAAALAPASVHDVTEREMLAILGWPRVIEVTEELRERTFGGAGSGCIIRPDQVPRFLVLRPDPI
ncbi:hypothetical protein VTG60DRAFT_5981 [Thermothelomyces hinnuleus]